MRLAIAPRRLPLRQPIETAHGAVTERELLDVIVIGADGVAGAGEAAPLPSYDGVELDDVHAALEDCRPILREAEGLPHGQILDECRAAAVLPQAIAAIDLALWDREGRRARVPVAELLGARGGEPVPVNALIGATAPERAAEQARAAVAQGFRCLKLKAGVGDDVGRVAAVRAAVGPEIALRIDANGAWETPERALERIAALEQAAGGRERGAGGPGAPAGGLELVEEPVHGVEALRAVQQGAGETLVAMDESGVGPGALEAGATRATCLKLSRCGGISGLVEAAGVVRRAGGEVYLGSTFDGPLGIAAALHVAAAIGPLRPCGLATLDAFAGVEIDPALAVRDGVMRVPSAPGLGVRA